MRDPHVQTLRYTLVTTDSVDFDKAPPLASQQDAFTLTLADGQLTVTPTGHYATEADARALVEPFLHAWEIDKDSVPDDPRSTSGSKAKIVDRDPPPPGTAQAFAIASPGKVTVSGTAVHVTRVRGDYPAPPADFAVDPDVEALWQRWSGYLAGRESLQQMVHFCLTVLQMHGGRREAAERFAVSNVVLNKLGQLSTRGATPSPHAR